MRCKNIDRFILAISVFIGIVGTTQAGEDIVDKACIAYSQGKLKHAYDLIRRAKRSPKTRLLSALIKIYYKEQRDLTAAFAELNSLYEEESIDAAVWRQAALAYARAAQLMQRRKNLFPEAENIPFIDIYENIIKKYPDSQEAVYATAYMTADYFSSQDIEKCKKGFQISEQFICSFKGNKRLLVPLHLQMDFEYIARERNYIAAEKHLSLAYKYGIVNPKIKEIALFRLGRINDYKLHNMKAAQKYYLEFLQKYPYSMYKNVVKRYLSKINSKAKKR